MDPPDKLAICVGFTSSAVNKPAPAITGIASKNENRAAFSGEIPNSIAVPIVAPDLEMPGMIAMACCRLYTSDVADDPWRVFYRLLPLPFTL